MSDLISRQAALKESYHIVIDGEIFEVVQVETLLGLPSVDQCADCVAYETGFTDAEAKFWEKQTESWEWCRDCKEYDQEAHCCHRWTKVIRQTVEELKQDAGKTGRWVKAKGSWCTPGGDPVWECSECGKGTHVYGIEHGSYGADVADGQWVVCPNCGARMVE